MAGDYLSVVWTMTSVVIIRNLYFVFVRRNETRGFLSCVVGIVQNVLLGTDYKGKIGWTPEKNPSCKTLPNKSIYSGVFTSAHTEALLILSPGKGRRGLDTIFLSAIELAGQKAGKIASPGLNRIGL